MSGTIMSQNTYNVNLHKNVKLSMYRGKEIPQGIINATEFSFYSFNFPEIKAMFVSCQRVVEAIPWLLTSSSECVPFNTNRDTII